MKKLISAVVAAAAFAVTAPAMANPGYGHGWAHGHYRQHAFAGLHEINMRQAEQRARIERGFHNGSITRHEFRKLMAQQDEIQSVERTYVSDGFLTPAERNDLHRRLDSASRHIYSEAHDAQRRF